MKILFDQGVPQPLRERLTGHQIVTAAEAGWSRLTNGDLLDRAEADGYDCLVTTDQSLKHQQNLAARTIAVVVLRSTSWPRLRGRVSQIATTLERLDEGGYAEVTAG